MSVCRKDCPIKNGGYCQRHGVNKTKNWVTLCISKDSYFANWEQGIGPGQPVPKGHCFKRIGEEKVVEMRRTKVAHSIGVGSILTRWFESMSIKAHTGCRCKSLAAEMDRKGTTYVEEHFEEYVEKMYASAREWRKGKMFFPQPPKFAVRALIRWAISVAKQQAIDTSFKLPEQEESVQ